MQHQEGRLRRPPHQLVGPRTTGWPHPVHRLQLPDPLPNLHTAIVVRIDAAVTYPSLPQWPYRLREGPAEQQRRLLGHRAVAQRSQRPGGSTAPPGMSACMRPREAMASRVHLRRTPPRPLAYARQGQAGVGRTRKNDGSTTRVQKLSHDGTLACQPPKVFKTLRRRASQHAIERNVLSELGNGLLRTHMHTHARTRHRAAALESTNLRRPVT